LPDKSGARPCHGDDCRWAGDPLWRDLLLYYEYFHGDTGRGLGAGHQTGWTSLVTRLLEDSGRACGPDGELCAVDFAKSRQVPPVSAR
jgi:hypothetical protein